MFFLTRFCSRSMPISLRIWLLYSWARLLACSSAPGSRRQRVKPNPGTSLLPQALSSSTISREFSTNSCLRRIASPIIESAAKLPCISNFNVMAVHNFARSPPARLSTLPLIFKSSKNWRVFSASPVKSRSGSMQLWKTSSTGPSLDIFRPAFSSTAPQAMASSRIVLLAPIMPCRSPIAPTIARPERSAFSPIWRTTE